jgi:hypothetical protein
VSTRNELQGRWIPSTCWKDIIDKLSDKEVKQAAITQALNELCEVHNASWMDCQGVEYEIFFQKNSAKKNGAQKSTDFSFYYMQRSDRGLGKPGALKSMDEWSSV